MPGYSRNPGGTSETVSFVPVGNIAATTVQSAISEIDSEKAALSSPALTGVPTAPTAANGTNTTQIATTEFVMGEIPAGMVSPYAGTTAPTGWLLCYGQTNLNTYTYRRLHAAISNTYGGTAYSAGVTDAPGAVTTFTLPDMRGRVAAGLDNMGGSAAGRLTNTVLTASNTIGATGGTQTHTLTGAQSGTSAHPHAHTIGASTAATDANHQHNFSTGGGDGVWIRWTAASWTAPVESNHGAGRSGSIITDTAGSSWTGQSHGHSGTTGWQNQNWSHAHTTTISGGVTNSSEANASQAHLNTQPTIVLNYIIKT